MDIVRATTGHMHQIVNGTVYYYTQVPQIGNQSVYILTLFFKMHYNEPLSDVGLLSTGLINCLRNGDPLLSPMWQKVNTTFSQMWLLVIHTDIVTCAGLIQVYLLWNKRHNNRAQLVAETQGAQRATGLFAPSYLSLYSYSWNQVGTTIPRT